MGAEKYGPVKFLTVDSLDEAAMEVIDLANYARYTFIKLRMLQASIAAMESQIDGDLPDVQGFIKAGKRN